MGCNAVAGAPFVEHGLIVVSQQTQTPTDRGLPTLWVRFLLLQPDRTPQRTTSASQRHRQGCPVLLALHGRLRDFLKDLTSISYSRFPCFYSAGRCIGSSFVAIGEGDKPLTRNQGRALGEGNVIRPAQARRTFSIMEGDGYFRRQYFCAPH